MMPLLSLLDKPFPFQVVSSKIHCFNLESLCLSPFPLSVTALCSGMAAICNLQDNKTLIIHPSSTIFADYIEAEKLDMGLRDTMIRLSVGIEDVEDLIEDFAQAFN